MALIQCVECGHQISDKAPSCPSCGAPQQPQQVSGQQASGSTVADRQKPTTSRGAKFAKIVVGSLVGIVLAIVLVGYAANNGGSSSSTTAATSSSAPSHSPANGSGENMVAQLGCKGTWSDDKKAATFNSDYKDRVTTVTGKVVKAGGGEVELAVLPSTLTYDVQIKLADASNAFNLENGQIITIKFVPTMLGGCILAFAGDDGKIVANGGTTGAHP